MSGIALPPSETNVFRIVAAIRSLSLFVSNNTREALTADRDYYVSTTGSDSNSGVSSSTAWLTKQKAMDVVSSSLDFGGYTVAVHVADGTYTGGLQIKPWFGAGILQFQGNSATPANVLVSTASPTNCIDASFGPLPGIFRVKDMKLKCAAGGTGFPIIARSPGRLQYSNIVFDSAPLAHVVAATQGVIEPYGNNSIVGAASVSHFLSDRIGLIDVTARDLPSAIGIYTVSGGLTFGQFAAAATQSAMVLPGITFAGAGAGFGTTGRTYSVTGSAIINTQGSGDFYLPGNAAGERINSGQYI